MKNDDVKLIQSILAGDENAFVNLVDKYQKQVHALVWRKIGDFHIAEEITQDTFLKVYQKLSTLKDPNRFSGWLYVIASRQCLAWLRKKRIETPSLEDADTEWIDEAAYSRYVSDEQEKVSVATQREVVKKLLAKLKESERTVMTLHYFGEMTIEEISGFLGVSASAIKLRLHRARQRLQKEETMIREALSNFKLSPNLTDNIMKRVERVKPTAPSGSKPFIPWLIGGSSALLIVLMLGFGSQHLARFQQPYSLDVQSGLTVELVDTPVILNLDAKPDVRNQLVGDFDESGKGDGAGQESNQVLSDNVDYAKWGLPKGAKARLGKGIVRDIAYSPDGNRLAVAGGTGIWLYDAHTGKELTLLTGHTGSVLTVAFSPNGNTIASGSEDNTVMLWDVLTGKHKQTLIGHENFVTCVVYDPKGDILASASFDATVRLWDVRTGKNRKITSKSQTSLSGIVFNPKGDKIAGWTTDNEVYLWDVNTGKMKSTLTMNTDYIGSVEFDNNGGTIAVAGSTHPSVQLWNVLTGKYIGSLYEHGANVSDVVFSSDGHILASACFDGKLRLWNYQQDLPMKINRGNPDVTIQKENINWTHLVFSPDNNIIVGSAIDGTVMLFDVTTRQEKTTILGHTESANSIAFNPDGRIIASGKGDQVLLWDVNTAEPMGTLKTEGSNVTRVTYSPVGSALATGNTDNKILIWDMDTRQQKAEITVPTVESNVRSYIGNIAFSPDGNTLTSDGGHKNFSVYLWSVATGKLKVTLRGHKHRVQSIAFSPDGNTLATGGIDKMIKLWDVPTGKLKTTLTGHTGVVYSVAFSPNGNILASGAGRDDGTIRLWDLPSGQHSTTLKGDSDFIVCVAFSPDGKIIASGNTDKTVELWNISTKKQINSFEGHMSSVVSVVFNSDGKTLASGSSDGTILLWDLASFTLANLPHP